MSPKEAGRVKDFPAESHPFVLDDIFEKIGQFGNFRLLTFFLSFTLVVFHTNMKYSFVFTASAAVYRCQVSECEGLESFYDKPWTQFSIPKAVGGNLEKCQRYKPFNSTGNGQYFCNSENYDRKSKIYCDNGLIFRDKDVTIANDFKIFCSDEWKLAMVGSTTNLGQFMGIILGGYFSDRYGRVAVLAYGGFLSAIIGTLRSFSPNYIVFLILGFLDNLFGGTIFGTVFVLALEGLGPKVRVQVCSLIPFFSAVAKPLTAFTFKITLNWRLFERVCYIPALGFIALPLVLPESFRWLLSQGEEEKAVKNLQNAAKINKRKLSELSIEQLLEFNRQSLAAGIETKRNNRFPIGDAFKLFPWRILNCSFCWFTNVFLFFGLTVNSALLGSNKYNSFMYAGLMEIPGTILPTLTINRYGRRYTLFGFLFLAGISIAGMAFANQGSYNLLLILNLLGKMSVSASFQTLYIFTTEIFPTNTRNTLFSFCSTIGRIGSILAPQVPLLTKYYASAPSILFATSAFLSGSFVFFLPETKDSVLPTTLHDARKIGQREMIAEPDAEGEPLNVKSLN